MVSVVQIIPIFLHLLALTKKNCVSIPSSETVITEACTKLVESVAKFKTYLDPVKQILPTTIQLSELQDVTWLMPTTNNTTQASKTLMKIFLDTMALQDNHLTGDDIQDSFFSTDRIQFMENMLKSNKVPKFGLYEQVEMQMADLLQSRLMRQENYQFYQLTKIMWVWMLLPQSILLVFFVTQFALMKVKERKLKRHTVKITRERNMVQGLLQEIRNQGAQIERPAPIELL